MSRNKFWNFSFQNLCLATFQWVSFLKKTLHLFWPAVWCQLTRYVSGQGAVDRNLIKLWFDLKFLSNRVNNDHTRFDQLDFGPIGWNVNLKWYHTMLWWSKSTKNVMASTAVHWMLFWLIWFETCWWKCCENDIRTFWHIQLHGSYIVQCAPKRNRDDQLPIVRARVDINFYFAVSFLIRGKLRQFSALSQINCILNWISLHFYIYINWALNWILNWTI